MPTVEDLIAAQKSHVETLFGLTAKAFEGVEKLVELNLQTARAALASATDNTRAAMSAKDAVELVRLQASLLQPAAEKAAAYGRSVYEIAQATGADIGSIAQSTAADAQAKLLSAVDAAAKNAPAGSEQAVALMKQSMAAANNAYEGMQKAVKQASETAEANFNQMASNVNRTVDQNS